MVTDDVIGLPDSAVVAALTSSDGSINCFDFRSTFCSHSLQHSLYCYAVCEADALTLQPTQVESKNSVTCTTCEITCLNSLALFGIL